MVMSFITGVIRPGFTQYPMNFQNGKAALLHSKIAHHIPLHNHKISYFIIKRILYGQAQDPFL